MSGKRYKFNGSTFGVQTALGAGLTITNATQADPVVVSIAAHGQSLGAVGKISSVSGMTELNDNLYVVDNPLSGSFEIAKTDGSAYGAFVAGSPANGIFQPVTFSSFCELTGANQQDAAANQIEVSTICSTAKEFEQGLSDSGQLTLDYNWAGNETVQAAIEDAKESGDQIAFKITFPGTGGYLIMIGTVQQTSVQGQVNGVWTASATIKLSGPKFILPSA